MLSVYLKFDTGGIWWIWLIVRYFIKKYRAGSTSGPKPPARVPTVCNCDDCRHNREKGFMT